MDKWYTKFTRPFRRVTSVTKPIRPTSVTLRKITEKGNYRFLGATLAGDGSLEFNGQDLGDEVEKIFGHWEYEWHWRIEPPGVAKLCTALNTRANVMTALEARFSGDAAAGLQTFLDEHHISYEALSRTGD